VSARKFSPPILRDLRCRSPRQLCTLRLWTSLDSPGIRCLYQMLGQQLIAIAVEVGRGVHRSMMWFRQMAQLSTTISHAHRATAFHCRHGLVSLMA
jgi:hypothetical protein